MGADALLVTPGRFSPAILYEELVTGGSGHPAGLLVASRRHDFQGPLMLCVLAGLAGRRRGNRRPQNCSRTGRSAQQDQEDAGKRDGRRRESAAHTFARAHR